jgi:hypothetical protein
MEARTPPALVCACTSIDDALPAERGLVFRCRSSPHSPSEGGCGFRPTLAHLRACEGAGECELRSGCVLRSSWRKSRRLVRREWTKDAHIQRAQAVRKMDGQAEQVDVAVD